MTTSSTTYTETAARTAGLRSATCGPGRRPGIRLARIGLRELEPHASYQSYWGFDGLQETATLHLDMRWDFENNYGFNSTGFNVQDEGLRKPFEVYPGVVVPAGHYRSPYFLGSANTDPRKWINAYMACNIGGFLSGTQVTLSPTLNIRRGGRVTSSLRWTRSDIDFAGDAIWRCGVGVGARQQCDRRWRDGSQRIRRSPTPRPW